MELTVEGDALQAEVGGTTIGAVEPRIAGRLLKLIAGGNRYEAAIPTLHESGNELTIIIREVFTHPANTGEGRSDRQPGRKWRQTVHEGQRASLR